MNKLNQKAFAPILLILFLIILGAGLGAGLYLVQKTQIFKSKAADTKLQVNQQETVKEVKPDPAIDSLTNELLQLDKQYDQIQPVPTVSPVKNSDVKGEQTSSEAQAKLEKMVEMAKKREDLLVKKAEQDPQGFLQGANLADKIDTFPEPVKEHIEYKIQGNGTLEIIHSHDFTNQKSEDDYFIDLDDKDPKKYNVHFSKENLDLPANAKISINSIAINNDTVATNVQNELSAGNPIGTLQVLSAPNVQAAAPGLKVAVVLVRYADDTPQFGDFQVKRAIDNNIKPYYKEISKGDDLNIDILGFYEIPTAPTSCVHADISRQIDPLVGQSKIDQYHKVVYVLPIPISGFGNSCVERSGQLGGSGAIEGRIGIVYVGNPLLNLQISVADSNKEWDARFTYVFLHELLHTLGLRHSNFMTCGNEQTRKRMLVSVGTDTACDSFEYGDPSSIMGAWLGVGLGGSHLIANAKYITEEYKPSKKTYTIAPLEINNSTLPQILVIIRSRAETYYISYRQPIGRLYDSVPSDPNLVRNLSNFFSGASIHVGGISNGLSSWLLRSNPLDSAVTQAPMKDGDVFKDPYADTLFLEGQPRAYAKLRIKQLSHDSNSVTLYIDNDLNGPLPSTSPSPTVSPSVSPSPSSVPTVPPTTHYRFTDDLTVLQGTVEEVDARLPWKEYTSDPVVVTHTFSNTPGTKAVWVEFKDSTGRVERRTLNFNLGSPTVSPSPSATSTPIPTITPTSVPTAQPTPAATTTPVPTPVAPPVNPGGGTGGGGGGGGGSSGGGGGGSSGGGGGFTPQTTAKRTIYYVRIGEDPYKAGLAQRMRYYPGEPIRHEFKEDPQDGKYFIYIKFFDVNDQLFKINGKDYITQNIDFSEKSNTTTQPAGGTTQQPQQPNPNQPSIPSTPQTTSEEVVIGTASLSTQQNVAIGSPISITLSLSGFSSPGRSIVGLFVRNQTGACSINDCGYDGWTQIRSYGSNGTDTSPYTDTSSLSTGTHMFAVFSLNADGTAGQLLAVDDTNIGGSSENTPNVSISQCQPRVTVCTCSNSDSSAEDAFAKCVTGTGETEPGKLGCNGGWCNGGKCETCQQ